MKVTNFGPGGLPKNWQNLGGGITSVNSNFNTTDGGLTAVNFVQRITANSSNVLLNPIVNFASGSNIILTLDQGPFPTQAYPSNTIRIHSTSGGGGGTIITSNGSNSLAAVVNLVAGSGIALGVSGQDITITNTGSGGGGGGSGGAWTMISEFDLGADAADMDFTSIPGTYRVLELYAWGRGTTGAGSVEIKVQMNGDTAGNYNIAEVGSGGNATASSQTSARIGYVTGDGSTASFSGMIAMRFPFYADTSYYKSWVAGGGLDYSTVQSQQMFGTWHSTSAVTRIRVFPASGNWKSGSRAVLYGVT